MKSIVLDIDGVLADFVGGYKRLFGKPPQGAEWKLTKQEWDKIGTGDFWRDLKPLAGATELAQRSPLPSEFFLLTSRTGDLHEVTFAWLKTNGIKLHVSHLWLCSRPDKLKVLDKLAPAAFLDDSILNAGMADKIGNVDSYLLEQPYNRGALKYFPGLPHVQSVAEFLRKVLK